MPRWNLCSNKSTNGKIMLRISRNVYVNFRRKMTKSKRNWWKTRRTLILNRIIWRRLRNDWLIWKRNLNENWIHDCLVYFYCIWTRDVFFRHFYEGFFIFSSFWIMDMNFIPWDMKKRVAFFLLRLSIFSLVFFLFFVFFCCLFHGKFLFFVFSFTLGFCRHIFVSLMRRSFNRWIVESCKC